ncbi:MAG: hypothetical protein CM15mP10_2000 [Actinomycetota bacterium]|nr:MAG: hypothetical protein CM15mP10_2000 [Actinomycetota bacterium]
MESNKKLPLKTAFKLTANFYRNPTVWEKGVLLITEKQTPSLLEKLLKKKHLPVLEGVMEYMNRTNTNQKMQRLYIRKFFNEYKHGQYKQICWVWEIWTK